MLALLLPLALALVLSVHVAGSVFDARGVLSFLAGASVLLVLDQLKNVLGLSAQGSPHDHFVKRFWLTMTQGGTVHAPTVGVAVGTIAAIFALRWLNRRFRLGLPELLLAIAAELSLASILEGGTNGWKQAGLPTVAPEDNT